MSHKLCDKCHAWHIDHAIAITYKDAEKVIAPNEHCHHEEEKPQRCDVCQTWPKYHIYYDWSDQDGIGNYNDIASFCPNCGRKLK